MQGKKVLGLGSILFLFSVNAMAGVPETSYSHDYDIGTLTGTSYGNSFSEITNLLQHSYTFDLDAPATVEARVLNLRAESGFFLGSPPLTHTLFYINLFDSGNQNLFDGKTVNTYPFGSTFEAVVTGELPAGKDYFVLITGSQSNDIALEYMTKISIIPTAVPEPESYAMFLAGLGLMGFMVKRRKQKP